MKRVSLRRILIALLALLLLGSAAFFGHQLYQYHLGEQVYSEAEKLVQLPDLTQIREPEPPAPAASSSASSSTAGTASSQAPADEPSQPVYADPYADALRSMDFAALREVNDDVLGWILIPNTRLSYPLLQGEDNEYYLNRTWKKSRNSVGAIFLECRSSPDLSDFNTIVYGHRMNNRSMFGILLNYKDQSYWEKHPTFYITDDNGSHAYDVFAAYEVGVTQPTYRLEVTEEADKQAVLDFCVEQSVLDTGIVPTPADRIVTLSTCTGQGHETRWVVQGVLRTETAS